MTRYITLFGLIFTILISCNSEKNMTVNGTIKGLKKGTVYLQTLKDSTLITLDSVILNGNDTFKLSTDIAEPELLHLYVDKVDGTQFNDRIVFFAEQGNITFTTHLNKFDNDLNFNGGKTQDVFEEYKKVMKSIDTRLSQHNFKLIKAQIDENDDDIAVLNEELSKIMTAKYLRSIQFALNNKTSVVAAYIGAREIPEANKKYLDSIYNGLNNTGKASIYGKELKNLLSK